VDAPSARVRQTRDMAEVESLYQLDFTGNDGQPVSLADFEGKPVLIVNTASKCGFTPQYEGLQELYEKYADRGLVVLGFPCDQFAHQEPGTDEEIQQFCSRNYGVTFPLSAKIEVNGKNTHPVFEFVKKNARSTLGSTIKWNFTKFLVEPDGKTVRRYSPQTKPEKLSGDIENLLD
jgi:glutathione peroxidase